ncbi:DUF4041 domain-containing protein [Williamsia deligens]|uniref:DUF4041 domain-containing protein n=1 Tax=Williamsia deligens TaxID=321325 RepID=A0ABW3G701_9NOCA|nr:DUF4041 domain-containing protein [Williamsia deligens]
MTPRVLIPGEALPLRSLEPSLLDVFHLRLSSDGAPPDLVAFVVDEVGKVRTDDDFVFYNNPQCSDGSVAWLPESSAVQWIRVHPGRLDAGVHRVIVGASDGVLTQQDPGAVDLVVTDAAGTPVASASLRADGVLAAMILVEIYRRSDEWRLRLLAQGYSDGLAALAGHHGVEIDDGPPPEAPSSASPEPFRMAADRRPFPVTHDQPTVAPQPQPQPDRAHRRSLFTSRKRAQLESENARLQRLFAESGAMDNVSIDATRQRLLSETAELTAKAERTRVEIAGLEQRLSGLRGAIRDAEGEQELAEIGLYHYRHRLDDSIAYKARLDEIRDRMKAMAKAGRAVSGASNWTVNGSSAQGRKMVAEVSKLMLRAYNADADHAVRTLRPFKVDSALVRLDSTRTTIARLGRTMSIAVTDQYHRLRRQELELTSDYINKLAEEKERQRELKEQQREQARADAEYAREQVRLERDRDKYADALARLESGSGSAQQIAQVRSQLTSVRAALDQVAHRRANMRLGYVYVISNLGAFGERMVKIGMTRRVTPEERVRELGDASVPFRFDTHALIFSEDAVALETALHQRFADRAVNQVNRHREFFYASPSEVRDVLEEMGIADNIVVQYDEETPADEWRRSGGPDRALLPT